MRPDDAQRPRICVPVSLVTCTPPGNALKFSPDRGYNVRVGDAVVVVRGKSIGAKGVVGAVDLDTKTLEVVPPVNRVSVLHRTCMFI